MNKFGAWKEYESKLNKAELTLLDNPQYSISFMDKKAKEEHFFSKVIFEEEIIIENYPKLKVIELGNCGITKITIRNCPQLEIVYLGYNQISEIEIDAPSLKTLNLSGNKLVEIDLSGVPNLECLIIDNNKLRSLDLNHSDKLKTLWCFNNFLKDLDCSNLEDLEDLNCSNNDIEIIFFKEENHRSLKRLDIDLLFLKDLDFSALVNLEMISLIKNEIDEEKSSNLLNLSSSRLKEININNSEIEVIANMDVFYDPLNPKPFLKTITHSDRLVIIDNYREGYPYKGKVYNLKARRDKERKKIEKNYKQLISDNREHISIKEEEPQNHHSLFFMSVVLLILAFFFSQKMKRIV